MKNLALSVGAVLGFVTATPCVAKEVVDTKVKLSCAVSGIYADGSKIRSTGVEKIYIDVKRINWNEKEPSKPPAWGSITNIKITSNEKNYDASLLKSAKDQVAFAYANDMKTDGVSQTLSFIYEIRLDKLKLKRTIITLFSAGTNAVQSSESSCSRL